MPRFINVSKVAIGFQLGRVLLVRRLQNPEAPRTHLLFGDSFKPVFPYKKVLSIHPGGLGTGPYWRRLDRRCSMESGVERTWQFSGAIP